MFREMRRKNQLLEHKEAIEILESATSGVLSLLGDNGYPYGVPLSFVYYDNKIYFHCAKEGHKLDAIKNYNKASFCIIEKDNVSPKEFTTHFRSIIAFGKVRIIEDEIEMLKYIRILGKKYAPNDDKGLEDEIKKDFPRMKMIEFDIEHLTGKEAIELVKKRKSN